MCPNLKRFGTSALPWLMSAASQDRILSRRHLTSNSRACYIYVFDKLGGHEDSKLKNASGERGTEASNGHSTERAGSDPNSR